MDVSNNSPIDIQLNVNSNSGDIYTHKPTRWSRRFDRLKNEVENNIRYYDIIDDFKTYNTKVDGKSTEDKLKDGKFNDREILDALKKKERYSKKLERNRNFETAQIIDTEIFAFLKMKFDTYVEPLINQNASKEVIKVAVVEKVVVPIIEILNVEGYNDTFLNYTADDILGMIFFLTGKCHLNWIDYDSIQSDI